MTEPNTEDYDHVKLKSPYSWYVGTRYGEAIEGGQYQYIELVSVEKPGEFTVAG